MRRFLLLLVVLALAAPSVARAEEPSPAGKPQEAMAFPLPSVDGKPLARTADQTRFRVPMRFDRVERFYRDQFKGASNVSFEAGTQGEGRKLIIRSKRRGDSWGKAVLVEREVETLVELTPVITTAGDAIVGTPPAPSVVFVIPRSEEAAKAARDIEHMERER